MAAYTARVRSNIHMVLCMRYSSGVGLSAVNVNVNYSLLVFFLASLCHWTFVSKPLTLEEE